MQTRTRYFFMQCIRCYRYTVLFAGSNWSDAHWSGIGFLDTNRIQSMHIPQHIRQQACEGLLHFVPKKTVTAVAVTAATINQWVFPLTQHKMICALKRFNCCNNDPHLLIWHSWLCSLLTVVFNLSWNLRLKISFACINGKLACVTENMLKNESKK